MHLARTPSWATKTRETQRMNCCYYELTRYRGERVRRSGSGTAAGGRREHLLGLQSLGAAGTHAFLISTLLALLRNVGECTMNHLSLGMPVSRATTHRPRGLESRAGVGADVRPPSSRLLLVPRQSSSPWDPQDLVEVNASPRHPRSLRSAVRVAMPEERPLLCCWRVPFGATICDPWRIGPLIVCA